MGMPAGMMKLTMGRKAISPSQVTVTEGLGVRLEGALAYIDDSSSQTNCFVREEQGVAQVPQGVATIVQPE